MCVCVSVSVSVCVWEVQDGDAVLRMDIGFPYGSGIMEALLKSLFRIFMQSCSQMVSGAKAKLLR